MFFDISQLQPFLQLLLAALLGSLIGLEREYKRKEAGLKTFSLVSLGTCFFAAVAVYLSSHPFSAAGFVQIDPGRVIQAVAIGIGFIGSGLIIHQKGQIEGLTTAAALWAAAAIGIGVGIGLYFLAILGTFLTIGILAGFRLIEKKFFHKLPDEDYER
ncbi:MgtC/SapB family protein [bacterium]|nr:MgtC/SapB family protein [bacterium]